MLAAGCSAHDWRSASREPVGLAPDPATTPEAVVQVYGARTVGWKGYFGVHTWVATKPANALEWTVYEVVGWRLRWSGSAVVISHRAPDGRWFGSVPELYADRRGQGVDELIRRIDKVAREYPYATEYGLWPGPNSNSFVAHVLAAVPEAGIALPPTAIGKDWHARSFYLGASPSGTGLQLSLAGLLGFTVGWVEGIEINVLSLVTGFDLRRPALKLPGFGRIGLDSVG